MHKAFLARIVEEGPIPAIHGVVRWRACDLIMRLHEQFGLSVSDDTIYRALKQLGFSHLGVRPKAYKQNAEAMEAFKKLRRACGGNPRGTRTRHTVRGWFQDEMRVGQKNKLTYRWPGKVHAPVLPTSNGPNRPICSVRSVPIVEPAPCSCCRPATVKPCSYISTRSQPKSLPDSANAASSTPVKRPGPASS
jgi:hypothetical protein